jgi:hypothetical protein
VDPDVAETLEVVALRNASMGFGCDAGVRTGGKRKDSWISGSGVVGTCFSETSVNTLHGVMSQKDCLWQGARVTRNKGRPAVERVPGSSRAFGRTRVSQGALCRRDIRAPVEV